MTILFKRQRRWYTVLPESSGDPRISNSLNSKISKPEKYQNVPNYLNFKKKKKKKNLKYFCGIFNFKPNIVVHYL